MKNAFDGLISRLDMAKKRIKQFQDVTVHTSKTVMQRGEKKWKDGTGYMRIIGQLQKF